MMRVVGCLFQEHDLRLVLVAIGLCGLASATALSMLDRARAAESLRVRLVWLAGGGAVAGCGIWATHFVAMLAYHMGLPVEFGADLTFLSAVLATGLCAVAFLLAVQVDAVLGGLVAGVAVAAMHYCGMAAMELPARLVWEPRLVAASLLIGIPLAGLSLHVAARRGTAAYVAGAGLFGLSVISLHFIAMSAVTFVPRGRAIFLPHSLHPFAMGIVVAACAAFIVGQGLVLAVLDRYLAQCAMGEATRMRAHIAELESTQSALERTSGDLMDALQAAAQASQAKSAFLASMSHELRTPLNAVIGFSDMMSQEVFGPLPAKYREYASDIRRSGAHLLSLINDILDLSRLDARQAQLQEDVFDVPELVAESLRMLAAQAEKNGITLVSDLQPGLPRLKADRRRVKQILINLVTNAVKFTPSGGTVTARAALCGDGLAFAVSDTGIGIAPQDIPKAMERFGQVDSSLSRKYQGTGLGLPLSRELAELHGGSLTLESTVNVGTTVTVILPPARLVPTPDHLAA